ncbi:hypothetical protein TL16_g04157 [Triparma laevis f. inornata]|uniref:Uncharacterized protein n=1 Tax=Triparma laevis f. inornata TaxID=1714386 RepID=A0A9W7A3R7_9STRA|nr:hypothetical protein TL16_g04157 [Triparma laevis f. inornata]
MSAKLVLVSTLRSTLHNLSKTQNGVHSPLSVYTSALSSVTSSLSNYETARHRSSSIIQGRYRDIKARSEMQSQNLAAVKLQSHQRSVRAKSRVSEIKKQRDQDKAVKIQAAIRGKKGRQSFRQEKEKNDQNTAAVRIQSIHRGREGRKSVLSKKESLYEVEEVEDPVDVELQNSSALKIQSRIRGKSIRMENLRRSSAALKLQAGERGRKSRSTSRKTKKEYISASKLQARVRGSEGRKDARQKQRMQAIRPLEDDIKIGDVVEARLKGSRIYCEGIIIGRSGSGEGVAILDEWDVDFGEGDIQEHVPSCNFRKKNNWNDLEIGDHVKVPVPGFRRLMGDAIVEDVKWLDGGVKYTVKFDDDEILENVDPKDCVKAASKRTAAVVRWKKAGAAVMSVSAFGDKKWGAYRRMSVSQDNGGSKRRGSKEVRRES